MRDFFRNCTDLVYEERWAILVFVPIILLLLAFYDWTLVSTGGTLRNPDAGHYGELAIAFRAGQVSMPMLPDNVMLNAPDPYDPKYTNGHEIWDLAYFHQKYYLYYGAAPGLLVFYPWILLTGHPMGQCMAMFVMDAVNLCFFALLLRAMARLQFRNCPLSWQAGLLLVYGLSDVMPFLFRQVDMYQIAIVSGATALIVASFFLFVGLHVNRGKYCCLFMASLAWGAAVGSRPTYVLSVSFILFTWIYLMMKYRREKRSFDLPFLWETLALAVPAGAVLLLIGWYNQVRFGSPLEFGLKYCVSGVDYFLLPFFSVRYVPDRIWEYFFMPFQLMKKFPYMDPWPWSLPGVYDARLACEHITGIFPSFPIVLLGLAWPLTTRRLYDEEKERKLIVYGFSLLSVFCPMTLSLLFFDAISYRYLMDLTGSLFVLTAMSLMVWRHRRPFTRWQAALVIVVMFFSGYAGMAYSLVGDPFWIWEYYRLHP